MDLSRQGYRQHEAPGSLDNSAQYLKQWLLSLCGGALGLILGFTVIGVTSSVRAGGCFLLGSVVTFAVIGARLGGPFEKPSLPMLLHTFGGLTGFVLGWAACWYYYGFVVAGQPHPNPLPGALMIVLSPLLHARIGRHVGERLVRFRKGCESSTEGEPREDDGEESAP